MVHSMNRDPKKRPPLRAAGAEHGECVLKPMGTRKTTVGQQPMITKIDADHPEEINSRDKERDTDPTEEPGYKHQQGEHVNPDRPNDGDPIDDPSAGGIFFARKGSYGPRRISLGGMVGYAGHRLSSGGTDNS